MKLEKHIVTEIIKYLNAIPNVFVWKTHGGPYSVAGVPDIIGCYNGEFIGIEVKKPDKKQNVTVLQQTFLAKLKECGGIAFVATSIEDVEKEIIGSKENE